MDSTKRQPGKSPVLVTISEDERKALRDGLITRVNELNFYADALEGDGSVEKDRADAWREAAYLDGVIDLLWTDTPLAGADLLRWIRMVEKTPRVAWGSGPEAESEIAGLLGCAESIRMKIRYAKRAADKPKPIRSAEEAAHIQGAIDDLVRKGHLLPVEEEYLASLGDLLLAWERDGMSAQTGDA